MSSVGFSNDKQTGKIAVCSAIFAGFAYVGYSVARNALIGARSLRRLPTIGENEEETGRERVLLRRLSQTTQTDLMLGQYEKFGEKGGRIVVRPMSVQQRIRELNVRAHQFADAILSIQHGASKHYRPPARSLQVSPWGSPRVLSPVDFTLAPSRSTEDLNNSLEERRVSKRIELGSLERLRTVEEDSDSTDFPSVTEELFASGKLLTKDEAKSLLKLLRIQDKGIVVKVLATLGNACAFTSNQNTLREAGALSRLEPFLLDSDLDTQVAALTTVGNFALNEETQKEMKPLVTILTNMLQKELNSQVLCSVLATLTNIATLSRYHTEILLVASRLYELFEHEDLKIKANALRLLVNLSCEDAAIPYLLAAEAPKRLIHFLDLNTPETVLLRLTSFLANLVSAVNRLKLSYADLPLEVKAPAPDTMLSAIFGVGSKERMQVKALALSSAHQSGDVRCQAERLAYALSD
ncbi:armadillo repeat-containing protein 10-like [Artemia franciscana]|uniref:Armadillo repeat-containing domain-containing protein n=1 Tax=Artemia franciscana TaxID=6661 RepID=A0AA88I0G1_ARTSF|nr:hypothetical protein QYM36_010398 [Artemia franciscana]